MLDRGISLVYILQAVMASTTLIDAKCQLHLLEFFRSNQSITMVKIWEITSQIRTKIATFMVISSSSSSSSSIIVMSMRYKLRTLSPHQTGSQQFPLSMHTAIKIVKITKYQLLIKFIHLALIRRIIEAVNCDRVTILAVIFLIIKPRSFQAFCTVPYQTQRWRPETIQIKSQKSSSS